MWGLMLFGIKIENITKPMGNQLSFFNPKLTT